MDKKPQESRNFRTIWAILLTGLVFLGLTAISAEIDHGPSKARYYLVVLEDQLDTSYAADITDYQQRRNEVYRSLVDHANRTQADLRALFDADGLPYTNFYLVNAIEVLAEADVARELESRSDVSRVITSPRMRDEFPNEPISPEYSRDPYVEAPPEGIVDNLYVVKAPQVWEAFDVRGEGIIVGDADTGVDWTHSRLRDRYAGSEGNHDYTWYDPWYGHEAPSDDNGHGTHTTGTMVGEDGIGVAPEAQWIACRNMRAGLGTAASYISCMQFLFAPFPQGGDPLADGDPSRGAHVVNNSWGCPAVEGCDLYTLGTAVEHLNHGGQFYVVSAGNSGPRCETIGNPADSHAVMSVGAVNNAGTLATFSSRGPVVTANGELIKPDIVAPGVNVPSAVPNEKYSNFSGTSMAGPHVAGVVALLWSAQPELIGQVDATRDLLRRTSNPIELTGDKVACGVEGTPNNLYGAGIIDAYAAIAEARGIERVSIVSGGTQH